MAIPFPRSDAHQRILSVGGLRWHVGGSGGAGGGSNLGARTDDQWRAWTTATTTRVSETITYSTIDDDEGTALGDTGSSPTSAGGGGAAAAARQGLGMGGATRAAAAAAALDVLRLDAHRSTRPTGSYADRLFQHARGHQFSLTCVWCEAEDAQRPPRRGPSSAGCVATPHGKVFLIPTPSADTADEDAAANDDDDDDDDEYDGAAGKKGGGVGGSFLLLLLGQRVDRHGSDPRGGVGGQVVTARQPGGGRSWRSTGGPTNSRQPTLSSSTAGGAPWTRSVWSFS